MLILEPSEGNPSSQRTMTSEEANLGKLPHSHSSPANVDSAGSMTPDREVKKPGKLLSVTVRTMDDAEIVFHIQHKALGQVLFDQVCKQLHLLEVDYFGLEYTDSNGVKYWLDHEKPMNRQIGLTLVKPELRFCVKFFTPDPAQLEEEYTRYLFCLQIKRDLALGILQCNDNTAAIMASYIVQAECGDYVAEDYPDHTYLSSYKFFPHQDEELERRIMENHKKHVGQTPAEADLNLLETARRCELYGIKMHPAKDHEGVPLNLAVAHMGVLVFQNYTKINTFSWAKIRKLSFKRKRFLLKLHPEGYGYYKDTVEFYFDGRNECKNFWKKCVEHHGFFRCATVKKLPRQKTRVLSRGSSFRYSGRTQKQIVDYVRDNYVKRQPFQRSQSFRHSCSAHSGVGGSVGPSISAQPLLPVGDTLTGTPVSHSCGSVALSDDSSPSPVHTSILDPSPMVAVPSSNSSMKPIANGTVYEGPVHRKPLDIVDDDTTHIQEERIHSHTGVGSVSSQPQKVTAEMRVLESPQRQRTISLDNPDIKSRSSSKILRDDSLHSDLNRTQETEIEVRRKRYPTDKAYFITKEILMTERTYKKDLEVLAVYFREEVNKEEGIPIDVLNLLFKYIDPIYEFHCTFLKEIEQRLATWEGRSNAHLKGDYQKIGDIMKRSMNMLELYQSYLEWHSVILERLDYSFRTNKKFEQVYKDFELQKACYLPLNAFILKSPQRLLHYRLLLDRLVKHYGCKHPDYSDCCNALDRLRDITGQMEAVLKKSENFVKLVELQRDITGIDNLVQPSREFIREGSLQKLSKKGYQQRMFFLFSDALLYTNRTAQTTLQFKVHGHLPLRGVIVEDSEPRMGLNFCFTIFGGNRALMVAASCQEEKDKWLEDLTEAIHCARDKPDGKFLCSSLRTCSSSDEVLDKLEQTLEESPSRASEKHMQQRSNTTVHVCWHRNTSVSMKDHSLAIENQLSGYLLRKFKNSNGWQKLWVVFTNFCLFFYKSFQDDFPLASLPLLGYTVSTPNENDNITKDYVFKLQFKNHVYFFRAESEYTFGRWMEVISSATQHSGRLRLFSRKESNNE